VAVALNVVEADGVTVRLPLVSTFPTPPSMVTLSALEVFQDSVVPWPFSMVEGDAERLMLGAGGGGGGGGGGSVFAIGGGGATFFVQLDPPIITATRRSIRTESAKTDFLMNWASFKSLGF
jgi:hypothetical protein